VNHLRQIKPVLAENADILLVLSPGMIGTYGEWWGSPSNNIGDDGVVNANTRRIIDAMLDATPPGRMMVTRYRSTKTSLMGDMATLNDGTAWRNTARARIGFENQCFMGDDDITNDGSGSIFNPRAIDLVLRNKRTGKTTTLPAPDDGRGSRSLFPHPGQGKTWSFKLRLGGDMPPRAYELLLHLAYPQPSLRQRPEYSIRLANRD
jgi:Domain of unknown function (DUF4874)/Domain of unknown function (DUF4832)